MRKITSLLLLAALFSCAKKDRIEETSASGAYQIRIAAVDNNGTKSYTAISRVQAGKVAVEFETAETTGVKEYNVEVSADGVNFRTVKTIAADLQMPNRLYRDTVHLD